MTTVERVAGRELDALIAEKVMGIVPCDQWRPINLGSAGGPAMARFYGCGHPLKGCYPDTKNGHPYDGAPKYSTDISAAWLVVEKFVAEGVKASVHNRAFRPWACALIFHIGTRDELLVFEYGETPALAICRAALRAVEGDA